MNKKFLKLNTVVMSLLAALVAPVIVGCSDSESYSNLLKAEEKATNWYLADKTIALTIPEDSVFITGEDAPYYKMDDDGYLYMQVINAGDPNNRAVKGDKVYFRYRRMNIKTLYTTGSATWSGNTDDMEMSTSNFWYKNYVLSESTTYGTAIQTPLNYLGYDCEVNLVLRSYYGFSADQSYCNPYAMNVKYYKAAY
jgi:hypothetical protein